MPYVLRRFDPWNFPLCTCPGKYSLSPYTGCSHGCSYCYITSYIHNGFKPRVKEKFLLFLRRDLVKADLSLPISIANSSDPYTPPEGKLCLTRETLKLLKSFNAGVILITKSNLIVRDLDILCKGRFTVSITITTLNISSAHRLEPYAPSPIARLEALKVLCKAGIPCSVRIDPIIPGINDDFNGIVEIVSRVAEIGVKHVVSSTYKAKPDNFNRVLESFPEKADLLKDLYLKSGSKIGGVRYMPEKFRFEIMRMVKGVVDEYGLTFSTCREGFRNLQTSETCDGTHLIPK
ncbi:MAG: radical SAM protein [Candidatus Methanomethylicia archaeon]